MSAKKFLRNVSGRIQEILGVVTSTGAPNDGDIPALDSTGRLDISLMPVGVVAESKIVVSSENLAAGDFVNIYNNAGTLNVRKADASTSGKEAHGFVLAGVVSPATAVVFFEGINTQLSALTVGSVYFLSDSIPGGVQDTAPTTSAHVVQELGIATAATEIEYEKTGRGILLV